MFRILYDGVFLVTMASLFYVKTDITYTYNRKQQTLQVNALESAYVRSIDLSTSWEIYGQKSP